MNIKLIFTVACLVLLSSCASTTQSTLTGGSVLDNSDRIVDKLAYAEWITHIVGADIAIVTITGRKARDACIQRLTAQ